MSELSYFEFEGLLGLKDVNLDNTYIDTTKGVYQDEETIFDIFAKYGRNIEPDLIKGYNINGIKSMNNNIRNLELIKKHINVTEKTEANIMLIYEAYIGQVKVFIASFNVVHFPILIRYVESGNKEIPLHPCLQFSSLRVFDDLDELLEWKSSISTHMSYVNFKLPNTMFEDALSILKSQGLDEVRCIMKIQHQNPIEEVWYINRDDLIKGHCLSMYKPRPNLRP